MRNVVVIHKKRRKIAQNMTSFQGDITSPFDLGSIAATNPLPNPYVNKAGLRLGISCSVNLTSGQLTLESGSRTITVPALDADVIHRLEVFPVGRQIIPTCAIAGDIKLYVLNQWLLPFEIANGTFT